MATAANNNRDGWHSGECWDPRRIFCIRWTVPIRYQNIAYVGHGATGAVMKATDTKSNKTVAIKMLPRPSSNNPNYKRIYRELKFLIYLNHPDAEVVQLYNVFTPDRSLREFKTLYLVMNFTDSDLAKRIKTKKDNRQTFTESDIRHIIHSLLRAVKLLHSADIIHRDIKPENIGVSDDFDVALLDFGLACAGLSGLKTGYVITRWWRAPEVIVNWEHYNEKVDVWSIGCIMGELLQLTALFPSNNHEDHLELIIRLLGTPDEATLNRTCRADAREFIRNELSNIREVTFQERFPTLSPDGIDFLKSLLRFDPEQRSTVEAALGHPWLAGNRDAGSELTAHPLQDEHRHAQHSEERWKELIWTLIHNFQEPAWALDPPANNP